MSQQLGVRVKDRITGFEGVVTGRAEYISGCTQALVAPGTGADGGFRESQWFDDQRLEAIGSSRIVLNNVATPGPDRSAPKR